MPSTSGAAPALCCFVKSVRTINQQQIEAVYVVTVMNRLSTSVVNVVMYATHIVQH
jgi:hypothetical protein